MEYVVYEIRCKSNGKKYYGRSQEVEKRWRAHRNMLRKDEHRNMYLQEDWNDYGEEMFEFRKLHTFESEEHSVRCEQEYIDSNLGLGYNIGGATDGGDRMLHNPRREETLALKRKVFSGEGNPMYGRPKTEAFLESVKKANSKAVVVDGKEYTSAAEAAREIGMNPSTVYARIKSESDIFSEWYYVDDKSRTTISEESRLQA